MRKDFLFLIFILDLGFVYGQYTNVQVNNPASTDPEEVTIAINPINPNILAAGANIEYFYRSTNGGLNWSESLMSSSLGVWGDPCVIFDGIGNLYFGHLSNPINGYWIDRIVIQKSSDNGLTWNDGAGIGYNFPKNQDKEWLAADLSNTPFKNNLYVAWTEFDNYGSSNPNDSSRILFSRSTNQGSIWSMPVRVSDKGGNCVDGDFTVEGAVPAVGPNGEIYLSWSGSLGLMFDKSADGGITFGNDIFVDAQPGGWDFNVSGIYRCNGLPVTSCDTSHSPFRGNIYINWSDQRNGISNTDIFFIKSSDGGLTWGQVKKVNDDNTDRHQFFTWMTIDQTKGIIYIVFYDRRNTTGAATDVFVARSNDGGETFQNFKVSQSSFTPTAGIFFGDYTNIAALNGKIYPLWMRLDGSTLSLWNAIINDTVTVVPVELSNLTAKVETGKVFLSWKTFSEKNNRGFEIQRTLSPTFEGEAMGAAGWITIGFVKGEGTSLIEHDYSFTDELSYSGTFLYRLKQFDYDGKFSYSNPVEVNINLVNNFSLEQNYPNPFNPATTIGYQIPLDGFVELKVYDALGNEVSLLVNEYKQAGVHEVEFDASNLVSGIYLYRISVDSQSLMKKMIVIK